MHRVLRPIDRFIGLVEEIVSISALVVLSVLVIIQVFWRYVLNSGILWTDEVITILMVMMTMFGSAAMTRRKLHTELLVFVDKLPEPARRAVRILTSLIGLAFLGVFLFASARYSLTTRGMVTTVLRIPMQYIFVILPIGAVFSIYEYLKTMPSVLTGRPDAAPASPTEESEEETA